MAAGSNFISYILFENAPRVKQVFAHLILFRISLREKGKYRYEVSVRIYCSYISVVSAFVNATFILIKQYIDKDLIAFRSKRVFVRSEHDPREDSLIALP